MELMEQGQFAPEIPDCMLYNVVCRPAAGLQGLLFVYVEWLLLSLLRILGEVVVSGEMGVGGVNKWRPQESTLVHTSTYPY